MKTDPETQPLLHSKVLSPLYDVGYVRYYGKNTDFGRAQIRHNWSRYKVYVLQTLLKQNFDSTMKYTHMCFSKKILLVNVDLHATNYLFERKIFVVEEHFGGLLLSNNFFQNHVRLWVLQSNFTLQLVVCLFLSCLSVADSSYYRTTPFDIVAYELHILLSPFILLLYLFQTVLCCRWSRHRLFI